MKFICTLGTLIFNSLLLTFNLFRFDFVLIFIMTQTF